MVKRRVVAILTLCVNLTELMDTQIAGESLFLSLSARWSPERLAFGLVDVVKNIAFTNAGGHHPIS